MSWDDVAATIFCLGGLNPLCWTGCAHTNFPGWVDTPPQDHYVGASRCLPSQWMAKADAFMDALKKKCQPTSWRIELNNYNPPIKEVVYEACSGGLMAYGLFESSDLNCSLIKKP